MVQASRFVIVAVRRLVLPVPLGASAMMGL